jgi:hypothetical protein
MSMNADERMGRILERLDQQDRNSLLREAETKEIAVRLAEENKRIATVLAAALSEHTAEDTAQFKSINGKLDLLLSRSDQQKGAFKAVLIGFAALSAVVTWIVTVIVK